jgi:D-amino-acid oxidase
VTVYDWRSMDRRTLLKVGAMGALGAGFGGCATKRAPALPSRPAVALAPVHVAWSRVIRTTVGLRPFRPSGFVLRAEKLDAKTLIHNFGHGGAGMSLSWGCGQRAAEMAIEATATGARRAAVLGCGAVGLAAARQLQRRGFDVTIYAAAVPPDTTSNMSLAGFTPTSGVVALDQRTPSWDAQFRDVVELSYNQLQLLVGRNYGVSWLYNYSPMDDDRIASGTNTLMPAHMQGGEREVFGPGEHPLPAKFAARRAELRIEPSIYLDAMMRDVTLFGGRVVIRKFGHPRELLALSDPVIVNCTGLGSRDLFGDQELTPMKGQLTVLVPQPEVDYSTTGAGRINADLPGGGLHMMPRADGIVLGGTRERDVWTLEPNQDELKRVVEGHREFFSAMRSPARGLTTAALLLALNAFAGSPALAQEMTGTYSIVARDPATGELGVAVQSRAFAVGSRVPHAKAGVGVIATQASTNVEYGVEGLALLAKGLSPAEIVTRLTQADERRDRRQVAVLDAKGRVKAYTGAGTNAWAGHIEGVNYSVQGNILAGEAVVKEMARTFETTGGELAVRLMAALDAAQAAGGDKRGVQSAAILVVKPVDTPDRTTDRWVDIRVDDSTNPLGELRRLLNLLIDNRRPQSQ